MIDEIKIIENIQKLNITQLMIIISKPFNTFGFFMMLDNSKLPIDKIEIENHTNILLINTKNKQIEFFEPHGYKKKEIYDFLKDKYGEWILFEPEFNKNTYFLWLLPILMFLIGGAIIAKLFIIKKN